MPTLVIGQEGVHTLLKNLNVNKAGGPDEVPNRASPSYHCYLPAIHQLRRTAKRLEGCQHSIARQQEGRPLRSGKLPSCIPYQCHLQTSRAHHLSPHIKPP
ncbi:hypothetical protein DPMN_022990 [Dreissena polymorpha]|uniref:Uncharacterized protein n=1 Tax=Dreissena polymorpha TaxID=45954 RepID=A0A9D4LM69_DREPO|nr:hypothetical protein DPMN_022990 [Dreissena polymorpha]